MKLITLTIAIILGLALLVPGRSSEIIRLRIGQTKSTDRGRLSIRFISVVEDSRCPVNVRCIWAGNAKIRLSISAGKAAAQIIELNTGHEPRVLTVYGHKITFDDLTPLAGGGVKTPITARVSVQKLS